MSNVPVPAGDLNFAREDACMAGFQDADGISQIWAGPFCVIKPNIIPIDHTAIQLQRKLATLKNRLLLKTVYIILKLVTVIKSAPDTKPATGYSV